MSLLMQMYECTSEQVLAVTLALSGVGSSLANYVNRSPMITFTLSIAYTYMVSFQLRRLRIIQYYPFHLECMGVCGLRSLCFVQLHAVY